MNPIASQVVFVVGAGGGIGTALCRRLAARGAKLVLAPATRTQDVASMIDWLLDPAQGWVTGQVFGVDGGSVPHGLAEDGLGCTAAWTLRSVILLWVGATLHR